ncbi:hypothetical protein K3495_g1365 [Podosphaera aphanis]|nr:hypothetical protein K3495_g1365 [Podosphaera aphanis]
MIKHTGFSAMIKMLSPKQVLSSEQIKPRLPSKLRPHFRAFGSDKYDQTDLPPYRPGVDLAIEVEKDEQAPLPQERVTELLDRNWIRASSSPGGAPVLFVKKPSRGLRFCVDYGSVTPTTQRDRYPLPLMKEKCLAVKEVQYLGFIITAEKGISVDQEKRGY